MSNADTLRELGKIAAGLKATPAKLQRALATSSTEIRKLVASEFSSGTNPWGRAWPKPKDGGAPLVRTGALAASVTVDVIGGAIVTKVTAPYSRYLQRGRKARKSGPTRGKRDVRKLSSGVIMRPRAITPFKKLPPTWALAIAQAFEKELAA